MSNFKEIPVSADAYGQADTRTEMTKLTDALRDCANARKSYLQKLSRSGNHTQGDVIAATANQWLIKYTQEIKIR